MVSGLTVFLKKYNMLSPQLKKSLYVILRLVCVCRYCVKINFSIVLTAKSVHVYQTGFSFQVPVTLYTLSVGATFGESILQDLPRDSTVVTQTTCELLRVEQNDFKLIWEVRLSVFFLFGLFLHFKPVMSLKKSISNS